MIHNDAADRSCQQTVAKIQVYNQYKQGAGNVIDMIQIDLDGGNDRQSGREIQRTRDKKRKRDRLSSQQSCH